jgi:hypothetical protein
MSISNNIAALHYWITEIEARLDEQPIPPPQ